MALKVSPAVLERLEGGELVEALVSFSLPEDWRRRSIAERREIIQLRRGALEKRVAVDSSLVRRRYLAVNVIVVSLDSTALEILAADPEVLRIDEPETEYATLLESVPQIRLDTLHDLGADGDGVRVAVLDTGIDTDHPDLSDDLVVERCYCSAGGGCCPEGTGFESGDGSAEDDHGHGTHVAGIVTSRGTVSPLGGAPDAEVVAVKVLSAAGSGSVVDVLHALDWIANNNDTLGVDLVNLSLGGGAYSGHCDDADAGTQAYATAIGNLRDQGVLTLAASSNDAHASTMSRPACVEDAVSVGAVYDYAGSFSIGCSDPSTQVDEIACFSNLSHTTDIMSPGARVTSTSTNGGSGTQSGTSQATPLAAACAAALKDGLAPRALSAADIERALEVSSTCVTRIQDNAGSWIYPRIDCAQALDYLVIGDAAGNDNFDGRGLLVGSSGTTAGSNVDAVLECGEPQHLSGKGESSVWWKWISPSSGHVEFNTFGSNFDTVLGIYVGESVRDLIQEAENDDASGVLSQVGFLASAGTEYQIVVTGFTGATGEILLNWSLVGDADLIFEDDFESGNTLAWSSSVP
ncbi:MAG: S8 family serine peptidase [Thermoanaerobaculia bacterium]|nr:S8 family serine peptidase [Thermoanaerobaculia bacterium]